MAEDPFVTSSTSQPHIFRPIPRRNFSSHTDASDSPSHAFSPSTPPSLQDSQRRSSDFLAQLNARLIGAYNARNGSLYDNGAADGPNPAPARNKSFLNMTKSTLSGIYDEDGSTAGERSIAETPWGTGAESPTRRLTDAGLWDSGAPSLDAGFAMTSRARTGMKGRIPPLQLGRPVSKPRRQGLWRYAVVTGKLAALFLFGVVYGVVVSHLHDTSHLAAVRVEAVDRGSWTYFASWGIAGIALGGSLTYVELVWGARATDGVGEDAEPPKEMEMSFSEQWYDIVRSVGAFMGIAFAIRRLPWQSTLQLTLTLALVNPALWYILDRSKPGLSFSLIATSIITSFIFLSNPDVLPSPSLPATTNATHPSSVGSITGEREMFAGVVSYDSLAIVTWVGSVLFCSCVCFGSIGRRLAVWDESSRKR